MIVTDEVTGKRYRIVEIQENHYTAVLTRNRNNGIQTIGHLEVFKNDTSVFSCMTLEMPWRDNNTSVSSIPTGSYDVVPYSSSKYPDTYEVLKVPGRSYILIHWGNYYYNTEGCILVGEAFYDINGDGILDITKSRDTIVKLKEATEYNDFRLLIKNNT